MGSQWVVAFDASDWIGSALTQSLPASEANGRAVEADLRALVTDRGWHDAYEYDPEADTIAIFSEQRDALERLVGAMRADGLIEDVDLTVYEALEDPPLEETGGVVSVRDTSTVSSGPVKLNGPYRWPETDQLRAFLDSDAREDWLGKSGDELSKIVTGLLSTAGLADALIVSVDSRRGIAIDGADIEDFRRAASTLGLDGIVEDGA